jgi:methyl-accepting chemotaxis protein
MADGGGLDLLRDWQSAMTSVIPRQLISPLKRQTELIGDVLERERRLQREVLGYLFAPIDGVFDLLEQSAATIRQQAEALEQAARALEDTAVLMKAQAELFERGVKTAREPADLARSVAGLGKRPAKAKKAAPRKKKS